MPPTVSKMLPGDTIPGLDASSRPWAEAETTQVSDEIELRFLHDPRNLWLLVSGLAPGQAAEAVFEIPGRGSWAVWLGGPGDTDIHLPHDALLLPEYEADFGENAVLLRLTHLHLAPQGVLASTPVDGEEWGLAFRIYEKGSSIPVAWLDEGTALRFAGGWERRPLGLKDKEPVAWGLGMNLVRLDFGGTIPEGASVQVEPEGMFIPSRSKDLSYVKGRIARGGEFRVFVEIPAPPQPEQEETPPGDEEDAPPPPPPVREFCGCLSFFVQGVWNRLERMEDHLERCRRDASDWPQEAEEALQAFHETLSKAEKFRTAQARGVLKPAQVQAVEDAFFAALAAARKASSKPPGLFNPYQDAGPFHKGMLCTASDADEAARAVDRAREFGCEFVLLGLPGGVPAPSPEDFLLIPGRVIGHFTRVAEFGAEGRSFRVLLDSPEAPQALPPHLSRVRAVAGEDRAWHNALASGVRLSFVGPLVENPRGPEGIPFLHVAGEKTPSGIIKALSSGAFYVRIHPGPEVDGAGADGMKLTVRRGPFQGLSQTVFIGRDGPLGMNAGEEASYEFNGSELFVRAQLLAGAVKAGEKTINLVTYLNPVYLADWVSPWLEELSSDETDDEEPEDQAE